ncbi:hypothetical protein ACFYNY_23925 [Streptomyces sp. NPDC006530]|uniref:hypothetical protein n=1 Tax=Streptomyces sp. NPDC006530 TaxID=3364750 RepID=UPI003684E0B6
MADGNEDVFAAGERLNRLKHDTEQRQREERHARASAISTFAEDFAAFARTSARRLDEAGVPLLTVPRQAKRPVEPPPRSWLARRLWTPEPPERVPVLHAWQLSWLWVNGDRYSDIGFSLSWGDVWSRGDKSGEWTGYPILLLDRQGHVTVGLTAKFQPSLGDGGPFRKYLYWPSTPPRHGGPPVGERLTRVSPEDLVHFMGETRFVSQWTDVGTQAYEEESDAVAAQNIEAAASCLERMAAGVLHMIDEDRAEGARDHEANPWRHLER